MIKNKFKYKYRIIKSSWGIAIDLVGHISMLQDVADAQSQYQNDRITYELSPDINMIDQIYILKGINFFNNYIYSQRKNNYRIYFEKIYYSPCDYQNEGLIVATIECLAKISDMQLPQIDVRFDSLSNKYYFRYFNIEII